MPDSAQLASLDAEGATVRTTCPYCGVGCGLQVTRAAEAVTVVGDPEHPSNFGRLCSKGAALAETFDLDGRLLHPEIGGRRVDWDTAIATVADGFARTIREHGPDAVAFYVSGQLLTEDYYVANKLIKGFLGTANIDTNSRLCMASSVAGHKRAFGADAVPGNYQDLELADLVVLVGSNLAWCHPVLFQRLMAARRARPSLQIVVIDPRRTPTADAADLHLPVRSGSDAVLFNGLLRHLARAGCRDDGFVERHTSGAAAALAQADAASPDAVALACGLSEAAVRDFFARFAATERTVTVYSQGINQSSSGTDKVNAIINCHLLTGRIGRPGMGPFSVTGQPNAMGGREVGALANQLAAHMDFAPADRGRVGRFWNATALAQAPGLKAVELFRAVGDGRIKAIWIMATNPAASLPDGDMVRAALARCPLVVVSDGTRVTETTALAHVLLPSLLWGEKDGTVTNSERRISRQRAFRPAPGEAKPDWWIIGAVAHRLGFGAAFDYRDAADIFREHAALSAFENDGRRDFDLGALADLDDAGYDDLAPVQWPASRDHARPADRLFGDGSFYTADRRGVLVPVTPRPPTHAPDATFPLALNTGRVRDQWHTMTRTAIPRLMEHVPEPFVALHPDDAALAGLRDGALAELETNWGTGLFRARISAEQRPGDVFVPMHWSRPFAAQSAVNRAVAPATDPISGQPELKHTPARVTAWPAAWHAVALTRTRLDGLACAYQVLVPCDGFARYELADREAIADAWPRLASLIGSGAAPTIELRDPVAGRHRAAWIAGGRLTACLFMGELDDMPSRAWLAALFGCATLSDIDRAILLAGRAPTGTTEMGPIVCACHGVSQDRIAAAIAAGAATVDALGAALKAGTNCGSCVPELARLIETAAAPAS
jgi:assimilatory nitrate reductase catalytic subunit